MIKLDLIGLSLTILLLGPKYFLYSTAGAFLLEGTRLLLALTLGGVPQEVLVGGVTGVTRLGPQGGWQAWLVNIAGPVLLYFFARALGGSEQAWWNPFHPPKRPFPVTLMRMAVLALGLACIRR